MALNDTFSAKWGHRIKAANDYFDKWERKFKCQLLDKYYEGFQTMAQDAGYEAYVLNLFESTFAIKRPNLMFKRPLFFAEPRPANADSLPENAYDYASTATDLINTIACDPKTEMGLNLEMAILDAGAYFGIIEVIFGSEWIRSPLSTEPTEESIDETSGISARNLEFTDVPIKEWVHVKRVPAHRFRVGGNDCFTLRKADWYGYYEYIKTADFTAKNGFKNTNKVAFPGYRTDEFSSNYNENENQIELQGDLIKLWKIWDNRDKMFYIITDGEHIPVYEEEYDPEYPQIFDLRFKKRRKGWYPIPFFFNWKSPQDEINEAREQLRAARRRAKRLWAAREGSIDPEEKDKLVSCQDGTVITTRENGALEPIMYPPFDATISTTLLVSKDDFNIVSGTSMEQRGQSNRTTATESTIINQRATIRDNEEREVIANWICAIGKAIILTIRNHFTLPMAIRSLHDVGGFFQDVPEIESKWKQITAEDLGTIDFALDISVETMSPVANDIEKRKFMEFIATLNQYQILASHPVLIKELAFKFDYKNNKVIQALQQAAVMNMLGQISGGLPPNGSNVGQRTVEQMTPPDQAEIENQLNAQGVPQI